MRRAAAVIIILLFMLSLTSCYDSNEIDDMAHIITIGVDMGVSDKWRLTLQFPTVKDEGGGGQQPQGGGGGGQGDSQGGYTFVSVDAPSFFTAISMLDTAMPKKLNFMHAQIIVFSEEIAKEGLVGEFIAPIIRFREIRRTAHVFVVKGKASDFIKENKVFMGSTIAKSFLLLMYGNETSGYFPRVTLQAFYEGMKSPYCQSIATMTAVNNAKSYVKEGKPYKTGFKTGGDYGPGEMPRSGENKVEFWGTALFDGDKMVGSLNGDETRYMLMARGEFKTGYFTFQDPKKPDLIVALDIKSTKKPKVKVDTSGEKPVINLKIQLDADLSSVQSAIDYEEPPKSTLLEETCEKIIKKGIEKLIEKCQNLNTDVFFFGYYASRSFLTIGDWDSYNWNSRFKDAKVSVEMDFIIRGTGTQIRTTPVKGTEEAK